MNRMVKINSIGFCNGESYHIWTSIDVIGFSSSMHRESEAC